MIGLLPKTILFEESAATAGPSRWRRYRWKIAATVVSLGLIGGSIFLINTVDVSGNNNGNGNGNGNGNNDRGDRDNNRDNRNGELIPSTDLAAIDSFNLENETLMTAEFISDEVDQNNEIVEIESLRQASFIPTAEIMPEIERAADAIGQFLVEAFAPAPQPLTPVIEPSEDVGQTAVEVEIEVEAEPEQVEDAANQNIGGADTPDESGENRPPPPNRPRRGEGGERNGRRGG